MAHGYYMVTGKNSAGEMINPGQQITRMEAIRLYTAENGWYTHEENTLGTIEPGKWADLLVLNANPLDGIRNTRQIHSVWIGGNRVASVN